MLCEAWNDRNGGVPGTGSLGAREAAGAQAEGPKQVRHYCDSQLSDERLAPGTWDLGRGPRQVGVHRLCLLHGFGC